MPAVISKLANIIVLTLAAGTCFATTAALIYLLRKKADDDAYERLDMVNSSRHSVIEVLVPNEIIGAVIGRSGVNITEIQNKTSTRINFRDEVKGSSMRVAVIRGKPSDTQAAERLLKSIVSDKINITTIEMKIPIKACGYVIGKNGSNIRLIRNASNTKLNLESTSGHHEFRILTITGSPQQVELAKNLVEESVSKSSYPQKENCELSVATRQVNDIGEHLCLTSTEENSLSSVTSRVAGLIPTGADGFLEVFVSSVESPDRFWIQPLGSQATELDKLIDEMTDFYGDPTNYEEYRLKQVNACDLVAVPFQFDKSWYRGQVTSVEIDDYDVENSNLEIHYVDFGETATFKWKALYSLKEEFTRLPFQAVECRLENVKPRHSNAWNEEAVELFKQLTYCAQWKRVMMKIIDEVIDITPVKVVELVDTSSVNDVNIASELMQQGFAERNNSTT